MKLTKILSALDGLLGVILIGISIIGTYSIIFSILNNEPPAIDVYRGKTTLEITYKDGVAIDSVVVYK